MLAGFRRHLASKTLRNVLRCDIAEIRFVGKLVIIDIFINQRIEYYLNKKLSYRRGTARCVVSIEILPIATQQCRNYLYDKS